jgi:hypothetical protein
MMQKHIYDGWLLLPSLLSAFGILFDLLQHLRDDPVSNCWKSDLRTGRKPVEYAGHMQTSFSECECLEILIKTVRRGEMGTVNDEVVDNNKIPVAT